MPASIKTDNTTARGILDETMKAKYLKGADLMVNWMKDRVQQGQFGVYWESAETNLGDYPTKHHSPTHHRKIRPIYTYDAALSPSTVQGCVNIMKDLTVNRRANIENTESTRTTTPIKPSNTTRGTKRDHELLSILPRKIQSINRKNINRRPVSSITSGSDKLAKVQPLKHVTEEHASIIRVSELPDVDKRRSLRN